MDSSKVGKAIKTLRLAAGYTQHQLAELMGVTDQAVSKWERCLSVPDISIVTKLSVLLNVDVDNLLEGNITYLEKDWQGMLILKENENIYSGTEVYGKPLVYFYLSYFMLAGIGDIYISCPPKDRRYIEGTIGDGSAYGIRLSFMEEGVKIPSKRHNTMVVYNNPFLYGPNLTRYFQRAMSRLNGVSVLTVSKTIEGSEIKVSYDNYKAVQNSEEGSIMQYCAPIVFVPKQFFDQIENVENVTELNPLYAEPMGNGMIEYSITDTDSLWDTSSFLRYAKKRMGNDLYDLYDVARNRNFI